MGTNQICCHPWEPIRYAAIHGNQSDLLPSMGTNQICCDPWELNRSLANHGNQSELLPSMRTHQICLPSTGTHHIFRHPWEPIRSAAIHGNQSDLLPSMGTNQICCHTREQVRSAAIHVIQSDLQPSMRTNRNDAVFMVYFNRETNVLWIMDFKATFYRALSTANNFPFMYSQKRFSQTSFLLSTIYFRNRILRFWLELWYAVVLNAAIHLSA